MHSEKQYQGSATQRSLFVRTRSSVGRSSEVRFLASSCPFYSPSQHFHKRMGRLPSVQQTPPRLPTQALRRLRAASNATCSATGVARERRWRKKASPSTSFTSLICKQIPTADDSKLKLGGKELAEPSTLISIVSSPGRSSVFMSPDYGNQVPTWELRLEPLPIPVIS